MFDNLVEKLKANPKRIVYTEGTDARILESAARLKKDGFLTPVLLGNVEDVKAAAKVANAHSFIRRLPDGYNTVLHSDGGNLSQGQRQLLAIARAAISRPPVLILDEATSSIDTRTEKLIEKGMDALMDGRTVFVIAHRLSTVRNANCIVVIEHGEIEEKGDHEQLLEQSEIYREVYTSQNKGGEQDAQ